MVLNTSKGLNTPKDLLIDLFQSALLAVDPYEATARHVDEIISLYEKGDFKRLYILGFGKALSPMMQAISDRMGERITGGVGITKYGHLAETGRDVRVKMVEAGHPLPDENGLKATEEVISLLKGFDERTLAVCLISGGGSALLVAPATGISLAEKVKTTDLLLKAGADIDELNTVRKHLSRVKGGRLAEAAFPGTIKSLILSDVISNRLDVIASGPTAPDRTTYSEALKVIEKYELKPKIPAKVFNVLRQGLQGRLAETPKEGAPVFRKVDNRIIASNRDALEAAGKRAVALGYEAEIVSSEISGEAREAGRRLAKKAVEFREALGPRPGRKICLLSGGETTVTVKGRGKGGRNMELALSFAIEAAGRPGITLLSAGTDGTDGPTDAAGAVVDGQTIIRAGAMGIDPGAYLKNNDSYHFFKKIDELLITGPTRTNVMDVQIVLLDP
jgi:glycerate 2-kinase